MYTFKKHYLWIIFLQLFAVVIFLTYSLPLSIRLDESQSLWQTSFSIKQLLNSLSQNVHVPLYHVLIHGLQVVFDNSIFVSRLFSLIFYIISVPIFYGLGTYLYNRKTAFFATTLYGISPFLVWFSSEIRMYTLLIVITILTHFFFARLMREPRSLSWWAYALCCLVGIYTHYFFFLVLVSHFVFFFTTLRKNFTQGQLLPFLSIILLVITAFLPWLVKVFSGVGVDDSKPVLDPPTSIDVFNVFSNFFFGFQVDAVNSIILSCWPVLLVLLFLGLNRKHSPSTETKFLIAVTVIPLLCAYVISMIYQPLFLSRYLIIVLPSIFLLVARLADVYTPTPAVLCKISLILVMFSSLLVQLKNTDTPTKEDYAAVSTYVSREAGGEDIIVASAPFSVYPLLYYYTGPASIKTLPIWNRNSETVIPTFNSDTLPAEATTIAGSHERLYLILSYDQGYEEQIKTYFDNTYDQEEKIEFSKGINVYVYRLRYDMEYNINN